MEQVTHKVDKEGSVVIEAIGELHSYEAVLNPKSVVGKIHISQSSINTYGIEDSIIVKDELIDSIQRKMELMEKYH